MGNFLFFPSQDTEDYILDTYSTGVQFGYSKYKLSSSAINSINADIASAATQLIPFDGVKWNTTDIETLANGALASSLTMVDQVAVYGDLTENDFLDQPNVTDGSGIALDYFTITEEELGYYNTAFTPPPTSGDYIIDLVLSNCATASNNRQLYQIKTGATDLFALQIVRSGSDYNINAIRNQEGLNIRQRGYIHTPANFTDWELYTISVIGGVVTLYINGAAITWGSASTGDAMDTRGVAGVSLGKKSFSPTTQGAVFDYETFIMRSTPDLSGFDITTYMADLMTLHGITI